MDTIRQNLRFILNEKGIKQKSLAQKADIPVLAFAGVLEKGLKVGRQGVRFYEINPPGQSREESMRHAFENLRASCQKALKEL